VLILRAVAVWAVLLVAAVANGALREGLIVPRLGAQAGHVISTVILCAAIAIVALLSIRWIAPHTRLGALWIGGVWLLLTLGFEFMAGHYLFGKAWGELLADYDLPGGRVWILVPVAALLAPAWALGRRQAGR